MENPRLIKIERGWLVGRRLRSAGSNARLPPHGRDIRESVVRLTFEDDSRGYGFSRVKPDQAWKLVGQPLDALIAPDYGVEFAAQSIEFPLWDVLGQRMQQPLYQLFTGKSVPDPLTVPCYDTTLYFDDLHLDDEQAAVDLIAGNARSAYERGHRAFKIKIGRGAMHMPLIEGTERDIAIIRGVRKAVGPGLPIMIDANNGYNVNLVKRVLAETADCDIFWIEEPFHEDRVLYEHLHGWMRDQGLSVLIADGEGTASPYLMDWARDGAVDVIQYDLADHGISEWLRMGRQLDRWGVKSAPHSYGVAYGSYASCHVGAALKNFLFVEWDHIDLNGLDASGYVIRDGRVSVPDAPGFGVHVDETTFRKSVETEGFTAQ